MKRLKSFLVIFTICLYTAGLSWTGEAFAQNLLTASPGQVIPLRVKKPAEFVSVFHMRIEGFPATSFSVADIADYQYRVARRICPDSDVMFIFNRRGYFKYVMYGSDHVLIGSFVIDRTYCQEHL
jgi:hypothetical protein